MSRAKKCAKCGAEFNRNPKYSDWQWAKANFCSRRCAATKLGLDPEKIIDMYSSGLSSAEIGAAIGCSGAHVLRFLRSLNVGIRPGGDAQRISHSRPELRAKLSRSSTGRRLSEHAKQKLREQVGPKNPHWNGGITHQGSGYLVYTSSPANGDKAGILVHRTVAEQKIGRKLKVGEVVHHIDRNRKNNDPSNLRVMSASEHSKLHSEDRKNGKLKHRHASR